jgi:hypothetical protein
VENLKSASRKEVLALLTNIRIGWNRPANDEHSSLLMFLVKARSLPNWEHLKVLHSGRF